MLSVANIIASGLVFTVFVNPSFEFLSSDRVFDLGLEIDDKVLLTSANSFSLTNFGYINSYKKDSEIFRSFKNKEKEIMEEGLVLEEINLEEEVESKEVLFKTDSLILDVPFYSQFTDIEWSEWRRNACGVVSLAMIIEMYYPDKTSPQKLLEEGVSLGYYLNEFGWTHQGLVSLAQNNDLKGKVYDLANNSIESAFVQLLRSLENGPVMASVYYGFDPHSPIPHLVVIKGSDNDFVYYNDPAEDLEGGKITVEKFKTAWKKRFIAISQ